MKTALVCGAGGFIGSYLVNRLKGQGYWVRGVDLKKPEFMPISADDFVVGDLRDPIVCNNLFDRKYDEVFQLAADMGGAGFVFVGDNDAAIMHNSALVNINMVEACHKHDVGKVFYSSSACIYPERNQLDPQNPNLSEDTAYPADPDSDYGWEKLFSERLYMAYHRNYGMKIYIARFHNIFGEKGTWEGGREKSPAAMCRKIAEAPDNGEIMMWGDGEQTRSFLHVHVCLEAVQRLMESDYMEPINIGSDEMVSINQLAEMIMKIAGKKLNIRHEEGPLGVRGRSSDNRLILEKLNWAPSRPLIEGLKSTYAWIEEEVKKRDL